MQRECLFYLLWYSELLAKGPFTKDVRVQGENGSGEIGQTRTLGEGVFTQCRRPGVQSVITRQHLKITGHKRMTMKTITKDEAASHDDEVALSDAAIHRLTS